MSPPPGLGSWTVRRARTTPERTALAHGGRRLTYAALDDRVRALAAGLAGLGVARGDRVAYLGPNHPAFVETLFATTALGAVFVPLNARLAPEEHAFALADTGARVLVHAPGADVSDAALQTLDVLAVRSEHADRASLTTLEVGAGYDELITTAATRSDPVHVDPDDTAVLLYTSGTTGRPKAARLSHANLTWNALNVLVDVDLARDEVCLLSAPLFHAAALGMTCLPVLLKGGTLVLEEAFDVDRTLDLVPAQGVTIMFGVPTMFAALARSPRFADTDLSGVRYLLCGGAPVPPSLLEVYAARGLTFLQGYGMTEAAPGVLLLDREHAREKTGTAGRPHFFSDVRLGDSGEILVRGPNVVDGYWRRPDESAEAFDDEGWFRSGDVATVDDDGFHRIVDRVKDLYISGGENVSPAEVEGVLVGHPDVVDAAVIGVPDERWGEIGRAWVVLAPGATSTPSDVLTFLEGRLARFKHPRAVEVVDALPRNPTGKLDKGALRAREH
ncbi:long-chain fatty acid--CoA ligase [Actinomycetospora endophytica]|uniref:Long-chain fatty acid--CoA ligase n=1 Tax=Actinomycetospora endophytica TaxID=2291215 RepID=A0ABS8P7I5_9PSEU|nr:long-chain fatty acid--CoA ligase [Actinomycetospora endophytica]MCD2193963.1 long-chain fatty acid--CoA ligase [Actinomycetospora endophytica]